MKIDRIWIEHKIGLPFDEALKVLDEHCDEAEQTGWLMYEHYFVLTFADCSTKVLVDFGRRTLSLA